MARLPAQDLLPSSHLHKSVDYQWQDTPLYCFTGCFHALACMAHHVGVQDTFVQETNADSVHFSTVPPVDTRPVSYHPFADLPCRELQCS